MQSAMMIYAQFAMPFVLYAMKKFTVITNNLIAAQVHTNYIQCAQPIVRTYLQSIGFFDSWNIKAIPQLLIIQTPFCAGIDK